MYKIQYRRKVLINTDPLRRCYDGHHFSSKVVWSQWGDIHEVEEKKVKWWLGYWRDLNDYAVKERGKEAYCQYRAVKES